MTSRLFASALLAAGLLASGATMAADATAAAEAAPQNLKTVRALFAAADENHDGQLSRDEARGHLPLTYASFDRIDSAQRGTISFEQFLAFTRQRSSRQADEVAKIGQWR